MSVSLAHVATNLVSDLGYWGLSAGLFLDSFGLPIPSEVLIPLAVVSASQGRLALWAVAVVAVAAQIAGALGSYAVGRVAGLAAVRRFGRYVFVSEAHLTRAEGVFARHGGWIAAAGRCVPFVRGLIGFPAGAARMRPATFVGWTAVGAVVWTGVLVGLGELLDTNLGLIDRMFGDATVVVVVVLVIAAATSLWRARRRAAREPVSGVDAGPATPAPPRPAAGRSARSDAEPHSRRPGA